jgi:hypothetical protein
MKILKALSLTALVGALWVSGSTAACNNLSCVERGIAESSLGHAIMQPYERAVVDTAKYAGYGTAGALGLLGLGLGYAGRRR